MDQRTDQILFALLRSAIRGTELTEQESAQYSPELLQGLLKRSSKHDVAHLLVLGLRNNALIPKESVELENCIFKAIYRYEQLRYEYERLCNILEDSDISFMPLKGSVIRAYYPEAWMRTSCDIDVLVHEEDIEKAKAVLVDQYGYDYRGTGSHDASFFSPTNIHIELHYDLVEDNHANAASSVLKTVWDTAKPKEGTKNWYEMSDEMYYFYHVAHMAKHFENGGCGIRPFIDLFILEGIPSANPAKRDELLAQGELLKFANVARRLSCVWLKDEAHDPVSKQMEEYILKGGVYGNIENRVIVQQQKKGGRIRYALSKIFIPYDVIKFHYPILQRHRWLTPIMEVRRWFKLVFCGHLKRTTKELRCNNQVSDQVADNTRRFLKDIGLQ